MRNFKDSVIVGDRLDRSRDRNRDDDRNEEYQVVITYKHHILVISEN